MTSCEELRSLIPSLLVQDIDDIQQARLSAHLADCRLCRSELDRFEESWRALEDHPRIDATGDWIRRLELVAAKIPESGSSLGSSRHVVPIAFTIAALLLLCWFFLLNRIQPIEMGTTSASFATLQSPPEELLENLDLLWNLDLLLDGECAPLLDLEDPELLAELVSDSEANANGG